MKRYVWLCTSCMILVSAMSFAALQSPEQLVVDSLIVHVVGSEEDPISPTLLTHAHTKFSQVEFDADLKKLAKEFDRVEPEVTVVDQVVKISIKVWKKPLIHHISWKGNDSVETHRLQKVLSVAAPSMYDRQGFNEAVQKLRLYYLKKGFFESQITYTTSLREDGTVDIEIVVQEGKTGFVEAFRFTNLSDEEIDEVTERLMTKEYCFWLSWLNDQGTFYKDVFRLDEATILSYIHNKGFLDATVQTTIVPAREKDRIIIDVHITKGPLYRVGNVSVSGNTVLSKEALLQKISLSSGGICSPDAIARAGHDIYIAYGSKGYIDARIAPEQTLRDGSYTYDINFAVEEGQCFRVGLIQIAGTTRTEPRVLLHETPLIPGEIFNTQFLAITEERLRNIGYFSSVNVYAAKSSRLDSSGSHFRDVHIEVEEVPTTAQAMLFGGWNSNQGISGGIGVSENNFRISGVPRLPIDGVRAIRGGGENVFAKTTLGTRQRSYSTGWSKPYFMDTKWLVGVDLEREKNSYSSHEYTINGSSIRFNGSYPLNAFVTFGTYYRLRKSDIHLNDHSHRHRNAQMVKETENGGVIGAVGVSLTYDSTNHPVIPSQGMRSMATVEYAGVGGDHRFSSLKYQTGWYWNPLEKDICRFTVDGRAIKTLFGTRPSRLPLDERLYLGGDQTMRGFGYNGVGPKFKDKDRSPRGGMTSFFMSGEYERRFTKRLSSFLFADAGNVWWKEYSVGRLHYSTGIGCRLFITDTVPLTFGLGFPIHAHSKEDVRRFFFSIGFSF